MSVRDVPPQQGVLAGREHDGPQLVLEDEGAGGVVQQEEGHLGPGELGHDSIQVVSEPGNLDLEPLLQDVFEDRLGG